MDFTLNCPPHFLGMENAALKDADVVVLPVPYEGTVSYISGTALGPQAIIRASAMLDFWDEEMHWKVGEELNYHTLSPVDAQQDEAVETYHHRLQDYVKGLGNHRAFLLTLGGEHSITRPIVQGRIEDIAHLTIVQIDAHCDLLATFQDSTFSHSCVMRRLWEAGASIIQLGIRTVDYSEYELLQQTDRIHTYYAHELQEKAQMDYLLAQLRGIKGEVYLSFDVDGLDPSIIPGTGTPQPGGLSWYQAMSCLRALLLESDASVRAADVVETIPLNGTAVTETTAAKIALKIISYRFYRQRAIDSLKSKGKGMV